MIKCLNKSIIEKINFIDCTPNGEEHNVKNVVFLGSEFSLTQLNLEINKIWDNFNENKKLIFIDCSELLLTKYPSIQVFKFVHRAIKQYSKEGIIIFCFLKGTLEETTNTQMKHLFNEVIKL
jgi:hypothetical protein